jgi:hypothetical protein
LNRRVIKAAFYTHLLAAAGVLPHCQQVKKIGTKKIHRLRGFSQIKRNFGIKIRVIRNAIYGAICGPFLFSFCLTC